MEPPLFRGTLRMTVHEAKNLPVTIDKSVSRFLCCCQRTKVGDLHQQLNGAFVQISAGLVELARTCRCFDDGGARNPVWAESFIIDVSHKADFLSVKVVGDEVVLGRKLGIVRISIPDIMEFPDKPSKWRLDDQEKDKNRDPLWYPLLDEEGHQTERKLKMTIDFSPTSDAMKEIPLADGYFRSRPHNHVTLYQDAHTPHLPLFDGISNADGSNYEAADCWRDMYEAILGAERFIYITGWSLWTETVLVRDDKGKDTPIGNLLKKKARDGVRVLLLIWDEKLSNKDIPGLMGTFDEDTKKFFAGSKVDLAYVYRRKGDKDIVTDLAHQKLFSHHQKAMVVDAKHPENKKKRCLVAFVGGLDITKGRYDSPEHQLYSTLTGVHKRDFHQSCVDTNSKLGPRLPWHDIHSKIEGPAAYDVARNFEERWRRQAPSQLKKKLVDLEKGVFDLDCPGSVPEGEGWQCQLLRSITEDSALFEVDRRHTLMRKSEVMTEDSLQRAYVHQIRRAQRFLYIESQYFQGSAFAWDSDIDVDAHHVIPVEIANRIVEKVKAGERFAVYIVIPMYPEGNAGGIPVQEMLYWQYKTISMMYARVAKALEDTRSKASPQDYLNFYCLGTREREEAPDRLDTPEKDSETEKLREKRRFMVYVHSKMMIIDDSYIIVGSANINERSLAGTRDSELSIGAYQDNYTYKNDTLPRGKVHAFRKALWAEHMNGLHDSFDDPASIESVKKVNKIAEKNWNIYTDKKTEDTDGYLMTYPYDVKNNGRVTPREGAEKFPDTDASVIGKRMDLLPSIITT